MPAIPLPLGRIPRQISLIPASFTDYHLLWLDQTLPETTQLAGALISERGEIKRPPTVISPQGTRDYQVARNRDGGLVVMWVEASERAGLFIQRIDGVGRAYEPLRITQQAQFPALSFDLNDDLHIAWLTQSAPQTWAFHYLRLERGRLPEEPRFPSTLVSVIQVEADTVLENMILGTDQERVYGLWALNTLTGTTSIHRLAGIGFPRQDSAAVTPLRFGGLPAGSLQLHGTPHDAHVNFVAGVVHNQRNPAVLTFNRSGDAQLNPVYAIESGQAAANAVMTVNDVALSVDASGVPHLAWLEVQSSGLARLLHTTRR